MAFQFLKNRKTFSIALIMAVQLVLLVLPIYCLHSADAVNEDKSTSTTTVKTSALVTISKETTYITKPMRSDGYPDYTAMINQLFSRGVTPENNASVLFWKAIGPDRIPSKSREQFFKMLGMDLLPEKGNYCVHCDTNIFIKDATKPFNSQPSEDNYTLGFDQKDEAVKRPWSKEEFPAFAEWLAINQQPLKLVVESSKRSNYYEPFIIIGVDKYGKNINTQTAAACQYHCCSEWLRMRSMLALHEHKHEKAWEDILACHRLSRLFEQEPTIYGFLVGGWLELRTLEIELKYLQHVDLTMDQLVNIRKDIKQLPQIPSVSKRIDIGERLIQLDAICTIAREGPEATCINSFMDAEELQKMLKSWKSPSTGIIIDWNTVLRMVNSRCDKTAKAYQKVNRFERKKALAEINVEPVIQEDLSVEHADSFAHSFFHSCLLSSRCLEDLVDLIELNTNLLNLSFGIAAYHAEHNSYPSSLDDLVPKYIVEIPNDLYNDQKIHYKLNDNGCLIYSVGQNGRDDNGQADDIVVHFNSKDRW
jgi:hypothetical protein